MMDVQEQMDIHNEIQDALTQSVGGAEDFDEVFISVTLDLQACWMPPHSSVATACGA